MIYRVDYILAVLLAGAIVGLLLSRWVTPISPSRLARWYFGAVAITLVLRAVFFVCGLVLNDASFWTLAGGAVGDTGGLLFGALFGLASRRADRRDFLLDPAIYSALCLSVAVVFAIAGIAKAFSIQGMTEFFTQSGYSASFLRIIITGEVLSALALLIPQTEILAVSALSVDMFGAIYTHIHNGDPLNDSTGAIGVLIRLLPIAVLWLLRRQSGKAASYIRTSFLTVAMGAVVCIIAAVAGSEIVRHLS